MEILIYTAMVSLAVIILILLIISKAQRRRRKSYDSPEKIAGKIGELEAAEIIKSVMRSDDRLLTNVEFSFDGRPAELDCVVVNRYGVFIIEVKNYLGHIVGNENDYEWEKYKITQAGNVYEKNVKNPIVQVKRQIYLLAHFLRSNGIDVWVRGYALLLHNNSPVRSEYVLCSIDEIDRALHTKDRKLLSKGEILKIEKLLSHRYI